MASLTAFAPANLLLQVLPLFGDLRIRLLQLLGQLLQSRLLRLRKALHKILVAALRFFHSFLQGRSLASRTQSRYRPSRSSRKAPSPASSRLRVFGQAREMGCLIRSSLNRQRAVEVRQPRVAGVGSSAPGDPRRPPRRHHVRHAGPAEWRRRRAIHVPTASTNRRFTSFSFPARQASEAVNSSQCSL